MLDLLVGIQPDDREDRRPAAPLAVRALPAALAGDRRRRRCENAAAAWRCPVDPQGLILAKETVALLADHYGATQQKAPPVTVSAINLEALVPVAQALDTFSVVYLQWLSNEVVWRARERVVARPHGRR